MPAPLRRPWLLVFTVTWLLPGGGRGMAAACLPPGGPLRLVEQARLEGFLMDALLQVATADLDGDGLAEVVLAGRNYERQEKLLHVLRWQGGELRPAGASPNLDEPASHLAMAVGDFRGRGPEVLAATATTLRVLGWRGDGLEVRWEGPNPLRVAAESTAVRLPGYGGDLAALARVDRVGRTSLQESVALLRWTGQGFMEAARTPTIGNIRALAGGDLTGDGFSELVVEVGAEMEAGRVQVWSWRDGGYRRLVNQALRRVPAFALAVGPAGPGGAGRLVLADERGRVAAYQLSGNSLQADGGETLVGWHTVAAAVGDVTGQGSCGVVVVGYPNRLHVLAAR